MRYDSNGLYSALEEYTRSGVYPFHMPGHKRNINMLQNRLPYELDITEIYGFDDLHEAKGILKRSAEKAQRLYGSKRSFPLINGSTCGILAAVFAAVNEKASVIIARNCHKSVYNACMLRKLDIRFLYPDTTSEGICKSITPQSVENALRECPTARAVIITSPTYEGVISDIGAISGICHKRGIPLIVDNAHGAHLPFCSFGKSGDPIKGGADIVISSLHKTLPALTQTSLAHVKGNIVDDECFGRYLSVFETSSPSYILMASIDVCFDFLASSAELFSAYERRLSDFSDRTQNLTKLKMIGSDDGFFSFDKGKLVISTFGTSITGAQLVEKLRQDHSIECEMAYPTYALAMTSVCDTSEGFDRLAKALLEIDKTIEFREQKPFPPLPRPDKSQTADEPSACRKSIYAYPPGIPIVTDGEIIGEKEREYLRKLKEGGIIIYGI